MHFPWYKKKPANIFNRNLVKVFIIFDQENPVYKVLVFFQDKRQAIKNKTNRQAHVHKTQYKKTKNRASKKKVNIQ